MQMWNQVKKLMKMAVSTQMILKREMAVRMVQRILTSKKMRVMERCSEWIDLTTVQHLKWMATCAQARRGW